MPDFEWMNSTTLHKTPQGTSDTSKRVIPSTHRYNNKKPIKGLRSLPGYKGDDCLIKKYLRYLFICDSNGQVPNDANKRLATLQLVHPAAVYGNTYPSSIESQEEEVGAQSLTDSDTDSDSN